MTVTVKDRQCLLDIAIQVLGGAAGVFALAERNGINITDRLTDGMVLEYDVTDIVDSETAARVESRGITPATEIKTLDEADLLYQTATKAGKLRNRVKSETTTNIGTEYDNGTSSEEAITASSEAVKETEDILQAALKKAQAAAEKNVLPEIESGTTLAQNFDTTYNDTFA